MVSKKGELLRSYLEEQGVRRFIGYGQWKKISCINDLGHPRGDRNPSASVNLDKGYYKCFACDLSGDVYDIVQMLENLDFPQAYRRLGGDKIVATEDEEVWLP